MEEARLAFRDMCLELGHEERIRNLYRVNDKLSNKAVFFVPNWPQEKFLQTKATRNIVLKCRQVGFTTLSAIRGLDLALWEQNSKCGIMAHINLTVTTIFNDLVKYAYNWFLRDWGHLYRPTEKAASRTELAFIDDGLGRPLESSMRVLFDFRGKTVNFLHVSEASRVEDDRLLGSLQGVPANGEVIYESTPQGRVGDFYNQWKNWRSLGVQAPYKGFFVPWYEFYPEEQDDERWKLLPGTQLTAYEQQLISSGLSEAHIAWRRWCIAANCQGDSDRFDNEYPSDDDSCFFTGEGLVFPKSITQIQSKNLRLPLETGFLVADGSRHELHPDPKGVVAIWEKPDPQAQYVIGADPSGGVGRDLGAAYVLNRHSRKLVARLWGQLDPADFANELIKLASFYNKAWVCVEANNHGGTVLHILTTKNYRNLYKRKEIDNITNKPATKVGFMTSNDTKIRITEHMKTACKNGQFVIQDDALINEMTTYIQVSSRTGRGVRREASPGCHDDLIMAACFALEMDRARGPLVIDEQIESNSYDSGVIDVDTGFYV